ncbi:MAG: hypothetical protein OEM01_02090 [Desulfobulbaceae bacterium]|nr:hypothetical protein [Desulfobulbaceae bacterium]
MLNACYRIAVVFIGTLLITSNAWAIDYTVFDNQELFALKEAVSRATVEEQEAYRQECQARLQNMSEEEKKQYTEAAENSAGKVPFVLQGQGYDKGAGAVIFGGSTSGKGAGKGSGKR